MNRRTVVVSFIFLLCAWATPVGTQDQGPVFARAPIIGTGAEGDHYRSTLADADMSQSSHIPSDAKGAPVFSDAVVRVNFAELKKIAPSAKAVSILPTDAETLIKSRDPRLGVEEFIKGRQAVSALRWLRHAITRVLSPPLAWAGILATDNFNRANNADLGAAWDPVTGFNAAQIVSNEVRARALDVLSFEAYNAVTFPNDQWAQITLGSWTGAAARRLGVILRQDDPTVSSNSYRGRARTDATLKSDISKSVGGVLTTLASENATTWATGNTLYLDIVGTNLVLKRNGATLLTATDSALTAGRAGLVVSVVSGGGGALSNAGINDWSAGDFISTCPRNLLSLGVGC